jgi:ATP-dependent Zn protease
MRARAWLVAVLLVAAAPSAAALAATTPPKAKKVSYSALRHDVARGKARVAEINRVAHSVELVLTDGKRVKALYPSHEEKRLVSDLHANHVTVVYRHAKHKKSGGGHPLRIAAAIVAVIAAAGVVLLLARRRGRGAPGAQRGGSTV